MDIVFNNLYNVLKAYAEDFERVTKKKLIDEDKVASGALVESIKTRVEINGSIYTVYLDSKDYLKWVESGTRPHFPPTAPILKWVREKKAIATREKTGDKSLPTERQVTYLVQRKIGLYGTEPTRVIATTQEELNAVYMEKLQDALLQDVTENLQSIHIQLHFN